MEKKFLLSFSSFNGVDCNIGRFFVLVVPEQSQFEIVCHIVFIERKDTLCFVLSLLGYLIDHSLKVKILRTRARY